MQYQYNCRLLLNLPRPHDRRNEAATSQYLDDAYIRLFATESCTDILDTSKMFFFEELYKFISLRYFNHLDATSKVMYQH